MRHASTRRAWQAGRPFAIFERVARGVSLLDVLVALALLALLVYLVRLDWLRLSPPPVPPGP
jgi:hypothetical protein